MKTKPAMKKILLVCTTVVSMGLLAQEGPYISDAIISIDKNNDLKEAYGFIEEAERIISEKSLSEVKRKNLQKYYYYQGLINMRIHQSKDSTIQALNPNALDEAAEFFIQSMAYEKQPVAVQNRSADASMPDRLSNCVSLKRFH